MPHNGVNLSSTGQDSLPDDAKSLVLRLLRNLPITSIEGRCTSRSCPFFGPHFCLHRDSKFCFMFQSLPHLSHLPACFSTNANHSKHPVCVPRPKRQPSTGLEIPIHDLTRMTGSNALSNSSTELPDPVEILVGPAKRSFLAPRRLLTRVPYCHEPGRDKVARMRPYAEGNLAGVT